MKKSKLFTPGPTAVPPEILETQARPLIHHRTDEFRRVHREVIEGLRYITNTTNDVVVLACSGTGAMEAAVVNLIRPGEKALVTVLGKFSQRWATIASVFGLEVITVQADWGEPVSPDSLDRALAANPGVAVVFTTHSETSTGVLQDVEAFARISKKHGALVVVDAISSVTAHEIKTDSWGLDAVVGGVQKGTMVPPGLAYLSLSRRAIDKMSAGRFPCYYFDLLAAVTSAREGNTPYTPATSLVFALHKALEMIKSEGIENVIARHAANAAAVRAAVSALGLRLFASTPCNATTTVLPPEGTAAEVIKIMENKYGVKVAGGQGPFEGRLVRLGHLGYYHPADMYILISAFESALCDLGIIKSLGAGMNALRKTFAEGAV